MIATKNQLEALRTLVSGTPAEREALSTRTFASLVRRYFARRNPETGEREATETGAGLLRMKDHWRLVSARSRSR